MTLTPRETATVLAALRFWQQDLEDPDSRADDGEIIDGGGFFTECSPLQPDEIDDLCERLNPTIHEDSIHAD